MIYIYFLICPIHNCVRYVGSSKRPKTRYKQHLKDSENNRTEKQKWISSLLKKGDAPKMQIIDQCDNEAKALKLEEKYVVQHLDTIMNIHMPDKNHGYVEHFKKTGIREKGNMNKVRNPN